jgi:hypothetical protein
LRLRRRLALIAFISLALIAQFLAFAQVAVAQPQTATKERAVAALADFPPELVNWLPRSENPIFTAEGPGHWDVKIRERGWILHDGDVYQLWFTGYDGTKQGIKLLGYATSHDGIHWTRSRKNPIYRDHWVEDMCVVHRGNEYFMFAEGAHDNHAELLTSLNGEQWNWEGELDVRLADGKRPARKPCGTPSVWVENDEWYLLYEWLDKGVWLARSKGPVPRTWTNVRDEPVLTPGPAAYDKDMIAGDQVIKYRGAYFAFYHGSGSGAAVPRTWNTDVARSTDLVHWSKYPRNPVVPGDRSSGIVVPAGHGFRLYTMHDRVDTFEPRPPAK